jgi:branched-chain amino acid transport system permease protein
LLGQYLIDGLTLGALYGILAISYALIFGVIRIINFAQGELITIGCMGALAVATIFHAMPLYLLIPLMVFGGVIAATVVGLLMEYFMFRPLLKKDSPALLGLIASLGVSIFLQNILRITVSTSDIKFPKLINIQPIVFGNMQISPVQLTLILVCVCLSVATYLFIEKTKLGLSVLAVRDNREMAEASGISVKVILDTIFITASIVAAIGGVLMGFYYGVARYDMGFLPGIKGFTASIMGGVGNVRGAMLSGLILGVIESLGSAYISSGYKDAFAFILLVIILLFRPSGLLGKRD